MRQAEAIRRRKPWERSTGPRTVDGKAKTSRNAYKGGTRAELRELAGTYGNLSAGINELTKYDQEHPADN